jgi:aldehyde:ferredoxin oxidoreductase
MARFHRLLRIDLEKKSHRIETIPPEYERLFIGGKGLATAYLVKELKAGIDPLGPENRCYISAGPLTGTIAPASARFEFVTKSPLTGIYLSCNSGGHFGAEIKACGYDLLIIEGVSARPSILYIHDGNVDFFDAEEIWGLETYETEKKVRELVDEVEARVISIGPAGENLVRYACLSNDFSRNAARGGSGAVFGSKKLKAIAVRGTGDIPLADLATMRRTTAKAKEIIFNNPWVPGQRRYGTARSVRVVNSSGFLPVENFTKGYLESVEDFAETSFEERVEKVLSCGECPVACAKGYGKGKYKMEGPEYETIGLFGPNLGIHDPDDIARLNYLCNQYGMDTISAGALIGGLLESELFADAGNEKKRAEIVADLLGKISRREGVGDICADGALRVNEEFSTGYQMPQVKGMGIPAYDPRVSYGTSLVYMTADRGACHLCAWPVGRELGGMWKEEDIDGRVQFVKNQQEEKAAEESLTVCQFVYGIGLLDPILAELLEVSTGEEWSLETMKEAGERCWTLSRYFNCREGISRKDDYLPEKFSAEGIEAGPIKGKVMSREDQDYLLERYYRLRQWNEDGVPEQALFERLGLEEWFVG